MKLQSVLVLLNVLPVSTWIFSQAWSYLEPILEQLRRFIKSQSPINSDFGTIYYIFTKNGFLYFQGFLCFGNFKILEICFTKWFNCHPLISRDRIFVNIFETDRLTESRAGKLIFRFRRKSEEKVEVAEENFLVVWVWPKVY